MRREHVKRNIAIILPIAVLCIFLYILLHEFGHLIVLWSVGADITEFSIFKAHVSYEGGNWTDTSDRWMHLNGALFPVIIAIAYMILYKRECTNTSYRLFSGLFALIPTASLMAWVVLPFLFMSGMAPEDDDVYKFLYNFTFDYPAWTVSIGAVAIIACCIFIAIKKGIVKNFLAELKSQKN